MKKAESVMKKETAISQIVRKKCGIVGILGAALIGVAAFLLLYGTTPLHVTNDAWIMAGYDETDIIQHYSGWLAFRNSDWTFPLGMASDMAVGDGTCISYTDSIPWAAILCKVFRNVLPETFQYFGWYALLCYVLQGAAAFLLVQRRSRTPWYSLLGTVLFVFAPILMERSLRHTALGSQWLILFAMLVFLWHRDQPKKVHYAAFLLLLVLAIGIHPYFLPMIAVFLLLTVLEDLREKKWRSLALAAGDLAVTYLTGCLIGVLGTGVQTSRDGYGYYSMNLNALYNPMSLGGYTWSSFFKTHAQTLGNYDGFNYLGAGVFAGILIVAAGYLTSVRNPDGWQEEKKWFRRNGALLVLLLLCTLFAVSNVVTWNDHELLNIPLPEKAAELCGIFRASARLFYPVYYCILTGVVYGLFELGEKGKRGGMFCLLAMVTLLQLLDLHTCIREKYDRMRENEAYVSVLDSPELNAIFEQSDALLTDHYYDGVRALSIPALKHKVKLYFSTANSGTYERCDEENQRLTVQIKETGEIGSFVVLTSDWETAQGYMEHENIGCYEENGAYYLFSVKN